MNRIVFAMLVVGVVVLGACSSGAVGLSLCTDCGQISGGDACCVADAEDCGSCGLDKGAPGCCKIEKGSTEAVLICVDCGEIKGGEGCCDAEAARCEKCDMIEGSAGCCAEA